MDAFAQLQPAHWFAFGFILLIVEMLTGTTYILWPAVAAGVTGLLALSPSLTWQWQLAAFALLTIALTLIGRPLRTSLYRGRNNQPLLNERAASLVGQQGATAGPFVDGLGAVHINDSVWRAKSAVPIAAGGVAVQVLSVDGSTLTVKPAG